MKINRTAVGLALLPALLLAGEAQASEILVWQHDNGDRVQDPVFNQRLTATEAVTRTLNELEVDYDMRRSLPQDLSGYDLVMTCLGWHCPG